jgi:integrase
MIKAKTKYPPRMHTDLSIRKINPVRGKRIEWPDLGGRGLYVVIEQSGRRGFCMRFKRNGKNARLVLGSLADIKREPVKNPQIGADLTVGEARLLASRINHERAAGHDVISDRASAKLRAKLQVKIDSENSFSVVARRYYDEIASAKTRRWTEQARLVGLAYNGGSAGESTSRSSAPEPTIIKGSLCDRWSDRPVGKIGPADVRVAVDEAVRHAVPGLPPRRNGQRSESIGRALHAALSAVFSFAIEEMRIEHNPCARVRRPPPGRSRDRVLTDSELVALWKACDGLPAQHAGLVKLLILSGQRLRECGHLERSEISEDGATWTLPSRRTKNGCAHVVPLAPQARAVIEAMPRMSEKFVFAFRPDMAVENMSLLKRRIDALMPAGMEPWTLHDLRRTMASGLQRLGTRLEITETALNHRGGSRSGIVSVYQRYDYAAEVREALERWAAHVERLVAGTASLSNIVDFEARRTG